MLPKIPEKEIEIIKSYFKSELSNTDISKLIKRDYLTIRKVWEHYFTVDENKQRKSKMYTLSKLGSKNHMYGKVANNAKENVGDGYGYIIEWKPNWYTGRKGSRYVFKHHLVMCKALGITEIPKGFNVHHVDGNKSNNNLNNLALLTVAGHAILHNQERKLHDKCK